MNMLIENIKRLRCVRCESSSFSSVIYQQAHGVIISGTITCENGHVFLIEDNVLDMLPSIDQATQKEIDARLDRKYDPETERKRPYLENQPYDIQVTLQSFAANIEQVIKKISWSGCEVLDIGAATAWSTRMLSQAGACCTALDISSIMLRAAEAQFQTGVYFDRIVGSWECLPFCDKSFDIVFTSAALHHASHLHQAVAEASRVLKPGGSLILVNEPVLGFLGNAEAFGKEEIDIGMNEHIYQLSDYVKTLKAANLHPHLYFPASLDQQLSGKIASPKTRPFRYAQYCWAGIRPLAQPVLLKPAHYLIGLSLVAIAQKREAK